jgi:hypothetical protein
MCDSAHSKCRQLFTLDEPAHTSSQAHPMTSTKFRIESDLPFTSRLLPDMLVHQEYDDLGTAVAVAAKCVTYPIGHEMRVINFDSGEVLFRTSPGATFKSIATLEVSRSQPSGGMDAEKLGCTIAQRQ